MSASGPPPEVTVVLPTRDRWPMLSRALGSALAQVDVELEVVVVEDDSGDETRERLAQVADPRLRTLRVTRRQGVAPARNRAVAEARAPRVAFLDDDDFWAPTKLRRQLDAAGDDHLAIVYTGCVVVDEEGEMIRTRAAPEEAEVLERLLAINVLGPPSGVLAPTELVRRVGGFDAKLAIFADWDLWISLLAEGRPVAVPELLYAYTEHDRNMHALEIAQARGELRHMTRKHRNLLVERGQTIGSLELSRWLLGHYRPQGRRLDAAREYAKIGLRYRSLRDLGRAVGVLLGERAMRAGVAAVGPAASEQGPPFEHTAPAWLEPAGLRHVSEDPVGSVRAERGERR